MADAHCKTGRPEVERPTRTDAPSLHIDTTEEHPSYAQILASRVSGGTYLYGSDFLHHHFISISIHRSVMNRSLSHDWPFAREEYIQVWLSEAQWASFVSSMNVGQGVTCTMTRRNGEGIPPLPKPESRKDQFSAEVRKDAEEAMAALRNLAAKIADTPMTAKAKAALAADVYAAQRKLSDAIPFVAKSFSEHVERVSEAAKVEVNAHVQAVISRAGLAALGGPAPLELSDGDELEPESRS